MSVATGEVFGLLGPNGAGKTTLVDLLCGLLRPTTGSVQLFGVDVSKGGPRARARVGVLSQETALYDELSAAANLRFAARLYDVPKAGGRIDELLDLVGLADRRDDRVGTFSGGMKRRLAIARALLHAPPLLILDEPTVGVDVEARHQIWQHVRGLRAHGHTVILTTNYLDEAEALCDRVAILREGRLVTIDAPGALIARSGRCIDVDCHPTGQDQLAATLAGLAQVTRVDLRAGGVTAFVNDDRAALDRVVAVANSLPGADRCRLRAPALAEVFELLTAAPQPGEG